MSVRAILIAFLGGWLCLRAERLPIRSYSTADGLPSNQINRIVVDSRGFVWFCTPEGLSRFDGYRVTNFGVAEGLPGRSVNTLLETRSGTYFVGTSRGLSQFSAGKGAQRFVTYRPGNTPADDVISSLVESTDGRIWCGTLGGALFEMLSGGKFRRQPLAGLPPGREGEAIEDIAEDSCGKLWVATDFGVQVLARDGAVERIGAKDGLPGEFVNTLFRTREGRIWAGVRGGMALMRDGCAEGRPVYTPVMVYVPEPETSRACTRASVDSHPLQVHRMPD